MITSEDYVPPELHKQYLWCKWSFHPLDNIQDKKFNVNNSSSYG
jgi:hypothetical protein